MKRRKFIFQSLVVLPVAFLRSRYNPEIGSAPENLKIAYCSKDCSLCSIYRATKANDTELKRKIASELSDSLHMPLHESNISCYGCKVKPGTHFCYCNTCRTKACRKETTEDELCYYACRIRKCAEKKNISNCNRCNDYPCSNHRSIKKKTFTS